MKQLKIINELRELLLKNKEIEIALLYGSFARETANVNSDIDIACVVSDAFETKNILTRLVTHFSGRLLFALNVELRNKIVLYFEDLPNAEISFSKNISECNRNFLGSEIPYEKIPQSILIDKSGTALKHLQLITKQKINNAKKRKIISRLINKCIYEFESCSNSHRRSDGYHFYFYYNIALHVAIQLNHLSKGETKFNFFPKNFISNVLTKEEQKDFYGLRGSLFLPEANLQKRKLLNFFYSSIQSLVSSNRLTELKQFCETIYRRDFLWNFRDINLHNPKIKSGLIYRTATMTLIQNENFFEDFISEKKIKTVVDLRADREIKELPYNENALLKFNYVQAPFDPWNQSLEFKATRRQGTNIEIAYLFFSLECKKFIKKAVEAILQEKKAVAIHCHAGKDRTGIFISMLHLLSGAHLEIVYNDYLASEMDTKKEHLDILLEIINQEGGIEPYFIDCGLSQNQIQKLKAKLINGK